MLPREKLNSYGPSHLTDNELVAVVLATGQSGRSVFELSDDLIARFGSVRGLYHASDASLQQGVGIGPSKAATIRAAFELGNRLWRPKLRDGPITNSREAYDFVKHLALSEHEIVLVMALDVRHRVIDHFCLAQGGSAGCCFEARDLFTELLRRRAASAILVHNHPSGDCTPSDADLQHTAKLAQLGNLLGISVLDHLILGHTDYISLTDMGYLHETPAKHSPSCDARNPTRPGHVEHAIPVPAPR